jgi:hypothetical protein
MAGTTRGEWLWRLVALAASAAAVVFLVLWLTRGAPADAPREGTPGAVAEENPAVAPRPPHRPRPDWPRPAPDPRDPSLFEWDPFGQDWERLFELPELPGAAQDERLRALQDDLQAQMQRMREELRDMREQFRDRMAAPAPRLPRPAPIAPFGAAPRLPGFPRAVPLEAPPADAPPNAPPADAPPDERLSAGVDVARLELPDALVLIVRGSALVEGSLGVKVEADRVVLSGEARDPDGVTRRFSRSLALDGPVAADHVDVQRVDGGYRVVLPRR